MLNKDYTHTYHIRSAAFISTKPCLEDTREGNPERRGNILSEVPVSCSRLSSNSKSKAKLVEERKETAYYRLLSTNPSHSATSSIWRQVNSSRSELRLLSMDRGGGGSQKKGPVQKNLS